MGHSAGPIAQLGGKFLAPSRRAVLPAAALNPTRFIREGVHADGSEGIAPYPWIAFDGPQPP
jgi:hypothetical protein